MPPDGYPALQYLQSVRVRKIHAKLILYYGSRTLSMDSGGNPGNVTVITTASWLMSHQCLAVPSRGRYTEE